MNTKDQNQNDFVGTYAGLLAITEVGLGSVLHAARIPFRGQLLSLNQIFILMKASTVGKNKASPSAISNVAAVLKSLSPAGSKLTPMLAIAVQGWLYAIGTFLFGHTFLGRVIGGVLASLWAFIQPIALYGVIFGSGTLVESYKEFSRVFPFGGNALLYCIGGLAVGKAIIVLLMAFLPFSWFDRWMAKISSWTAPKHRPTNPSPLKGALKQVCRPFFIGSIILTGILLYFSEKNSASLIWHLLRPLAVGFIVFYAMRSFPIEKIVRRSFTGAFGQSLSAALQRLQNYSKTSTGSPTDKTP